METYSRLGKFLFLCLRHPGSLNTTSTPLSMFAYSPLGTFKHSKLFQKSLNTLPSNCVESYRRLYNSQSRPSSVNISLNFFKPFRLSVGLFAHTSDVVPKFFALFSITAFGEAVPSVLCYSSFVAFDIGTFCNYKRYFSTFRSSSSSSSYSSSSSSSSSSPYD